MRYAVMDTGSNTIRLGIYDYTDGKLNIIYNNAIFANLASYIKDNTLAQAGIEKAAESINALNEKAKEYDVSPHVFATAAIRNAQNTEEICEKIHAKTGFRVDVLSGNDEATLSFLGAKSDFLFDNGVMADVGGGSSEIIPFKNKEPNGAFSIPIGSLKAYKNFVHSALPTKNELQIIKSNITDYLKQNAKSPEKTHNLCITGGGTTASLKLTSAFLNEQLITPDALYKILDIIVKKPAYASEIIMRTVPKRASTIAPAIAIYLAVLEYFGASAIHISDKGIKEGYILNKLVH